jgi:hypothetical protein
MSLKHSIAKNQKIFIRGRQVAVLRNFGTLCDIRRRNGGFLYFPTHRVAVSYELLDQLNDDTILQIANLDSGDIYSCTVREFREWGEVIQYAGFEKQIQVEISRLNHTSKPRRNKRRKNGPLNIAPAPVAPTWQQMSMITNR